MTVSQAGYHILMVLSIVDGKYDKIEGQVILDYLSRTYGEGFDLDVENEKIKKLGKDKIADHFAHAARVFKEKADEDQRLEFLTFAVDLVTADDSISKEEHKIISSLAKSWGIDIQPVLARKVPNPQGEA